VLTAARCGAARGTGPGPEAVARENSRQQRNALLVLHSLKSCVVVESGQTCDCQHVRPQHVVMLERGPPVQQSPTTSHHAIFFSSGVWGWSRAPPWYSGWLFGTRSGQLKDPNQLTGNQCPEDIIQPHDRGMATTAHTTRRALKRARCAHSPGLSVCGQRGVDGSAAPPEPHYREVQLDGDDRRDFVAPGEAWRAFHAQRTRSPASAARVTAR